MTLEYNETGLESGARPFNHRNDNQRRLGSYSQKVPKDNYLTEKIFTQRIERNNLILKICITRLADICIGYAIRISFPLVYANHIHMASISLY